MFNKLNTLTNITNLFNIYLLDNVSSTKDDYITKLYLNNYLLKVLESNSNRFTLDVDKDVLKYTDYLINKLIDISYSTFGEYYNVLLNVERILNINTSTRYNRAKLLLLTESIYSNCISNTESIEDITTLLLIILVIFKTDDLVKLLITNRLNKLITNHQEPHILGGGPADGFRLYSFDSMLSMVSKSNVIDVKVFLALKELFTNYYNIDIETYNTMYIEASITNVY